MKVRFNSLLLAFSLSVTPAFLFGQDIVPAEGTDNTANTAVEKKEEKKDTGKKGAGVFTMGEIVVRDRAVANIEDATSTIEITAEDIEAHGSKDLGDALRHVPGIKVEAGSDGSTGFYMRGWRDSKVNVLIDGLPVQDGFKEFIDASRIPVQNIARIIVTKGSSSALYGTSGSIGAINIITQKPVSEFAKFSIEYGTSDNNAFNIAMGAPMGNFYYWLTASARVSDGYDVSDSLDAKTRAAWARKLIAPVVNNLDFDEMVNDDDVDDNDALYNYINKEEWSKTNYKKYQVAGKVGYQLSDGIEFGLSADYYSGDQYGYSPQTSGLASYNNSTQLWSLPSVSKVFSGGYSIYPRDYNYKVAPYFLVDLDKVSVKGNVFFRKQLNSYELYNDPEYTILSWPIERWTDFSVGFNLYPSYKLASWNKLNGAISFRHDDHLEVATDMEALPDTDVTGQELTLALEDEMSFLDNMIQATVGISYDAKNISKYKKNVAGSMVEQDLISDDSYIWGTSDSFNPVVGTVVEPLKDFLVVRASGSMKTQFPSLQQYAGVLPGYSLKPEKSYNTSGGFELLLLDRALSFRTDYFYNYFKDKIESYRDFLLGKQSFNTGKVQCHGVELTFTSSFKNIMNYADVDLGLSYAFINNRIDSDIANSSVNKGDKYENTPEHQLMADLRCRLKTGFAMTVSAIHERNAIKYVMKSTPDTATPEDYSTQYFKEVQLHNPLRIDIKVAQTFAEKYTFYVMCKNITDDYDTDPFDPGPGRMWYFGGSAQL